MSVAFDGGSVMGFLVGALGVLGLGTLHLKDTSGPSINILIKVLAITSLAIAPLLSSAPRPV